jgi:spermidine/putrescine-binding protein
MKKVKFLVVLALLALPLVQMAAQGKQLILYTWDEMFPQEIFDDFKRDTGIEVVLKTFEFNEDMYDSLDKGDVYDLVIADDYIVESAILDGLAQKLDKNRITNLRNINPFYQHQFYDPYDEYTIPYGAGIQTIVYDPAKVKLDIKGFTDLWNNSLRGKVGITANYRVINGMALKVLGKSYNAESVADITAAGKKLNDLAPNIGLVQDMHLDDAILSGQISVALMYTDQVTKSKIVNPNLKVVYPREGIGFGIMAAFITSKAPNAAAAHTFLNYILDPKRGAQCFEYLGYYCTYAASEQYISPEYREFLTLPKLDNSDTPRFGNFELMLNLSQEAEEAHVEVWKTFNGVMAAGR